MTKAKRYDTVVLLESIGMFQQAKKGQWWKSIRHPTKPMISKWSPTPARRKGSRGGPSRADCRVSAGAFLPPSAWRQRNTCGVRFSDGTEVIVSAEELYTQSGR